MPSGLRLRDCAERGEDPAGATMYVTLEPCAHTGRQPPCVEAILEAGIGRVVIGSDDPSEKASGRGPGDAARRRGGGRARRRRGGDRGAAAQPAVPQARPHRPAAGDAEAGDVARRPDDDRGGRLALDLRPREPRAGPPLARRIRRDRRRHRHRPRRRPPPHRPPKPFRSRLSPDRIKSATAERRCGSRSGSSSTAGPGCRSTRSCCRRVDVARSLVVLVDAGRHTPIPVCRPARVAARRDPGRRHGIEAALSRSRTGAASPVSSSRVAARWPRPSWQADAIDEARTFVAPVLLGSPAPTTGPARQMPCPARSSRSARMC